MWDFLTIHKREGKKEGRKEKTYLAIKQMATIKKVQFKFKAAFHTLYFFLIGNL
jgi:hypothetical protein